MSTNRQRQIVFYKNYFHRFFETLTEKVKTKIVWTLELVEESERISEKYLKHIEGTEGLYEIRIQSGGSIFRVFCFFDKEKIVVIANGFQKKTQKTPKREIDVALRIKAEYENEE